MSTDERREIKFQLWGWILFLLCASFFIASSIRSGDALSFVGSAIFFAACLVFIVPLVLRLKGGPRR